MQTLRIPLVLLILLGVSGSRLAAQRSYAENLVKNPGFEEYKHCPERLGSFDRDVRYWDCPTLGSTDYFSGCSDIMAVPRNYNGFQEARNGKAYAGMYLYAPGDYREYIQVELRRPLSRDSVYQLGLSLSLAELSDTGVGQLGFVFSEKRLKFPIKTVITSEMLDSIPGVQGHPIELVLDSVSRESLDWEDHKLYYRASGRERYLLMGNFRNDSATKVYPNPGGRKRGAYYYIDRLSLFRVRAGRPQPSYQLDTTYVFEDILFDFDKYELDSIGRRDVENMYFFLRERPGYQIHISGHTDSWGDHRYNWELSRKRAECIAEELVRLGIPRSQVHTRSHGSEKPVASNRSDGGRQLNRRAEFVLRRPR